ncbi:MAG: ABC transporter ATP-binding protein [Thalassobaculales bacterium]
MTAALEFDGIVHRYGAPAAVDGLSLTVGAGEVVCLLGPSGCGKTTALRLAAGLEKVQQGAVRLAGRLVGAPHLHVPPEARGIGMVFQDYALFPHLTVAQNVGFGLAAAAGREARVAEVLALVGMAAQAGAHPHMLSGGQQQRVALARALAPGPGVMLLDEPFSGLDARLRDQVRDETLHALRAAGTATLMVTHDSEEAMFMADRIAVMRAGRLVQVATPVELYCRPANRFVAAFFGEVNTLTGVVRGGRIDTPLGPVAAGGLAEGSDADVVIRPEALHLAEGEGARVLEARLLGRTSLIHLELAGLHLHSRMPGVYVPAAGRSQAVRLDPSQTFVFARAPA